MIASQQVNWWVVHQWVAPLLEQARSWPMAGTPEWIQLDDDDPRKLAAVLDGGQHWALRVDTCQEAHCAASRDIAAAALWSQIAQQQLAEARWHAERPWARRRTSAA